MNRRSLRNYSVSMKTAADIVLSLLIVSEKAARLSRICRQNDHLLCLLIEEKKNEEKNTRFLKDFKTLTDVLVQQLIKYDLEKEFPELKNSIYGEENNTFTNTLGEFVTVILTESKDNTIHLLEKILDGDRKAAHLLAEAIHSSVSINDVPVHVLPEEGPNLDLQELALWIDPIDSTAEFINGGNNFSETISLSGLNCVTVLIGIFNRHTGAPLVGVINQPFYVLEDERWTGRTFWGISVNDFVRTSVPSSVSSTRTEPLIAISSNESDVNKKKLEDAGFNLVSPPGAGYKILCVILDIVDAYVLSQGTTYFWDTCGSHAIMKGLKGNIWNYEKALGGDLCEICYHEKNECLNIKQYCNRCGFIACKNDTLTRKIISALQ